MSISTSRRVYSVFDAIVTEFVGRRICACCLPASVILHERLDALGIDNRLQLGFLTIHDGDDVKKTHAQITASTFLHVWVSVGGVDLDVGSAVNRALVGPRKYPQPHQIILTHDRPPPSHRSMDYTRCVDLISMFAKDVDPGVFIDLGCDEFALDSYHTQRAFYVYANEPLEYWRNAPEVIIRIRRNVASHLNN